MKDSIFSCWNLSLPFICKFSKYLNKNYNYESWLEKRLYKEAIYNKNNWNILKQNKCNIFWNVISCYRDLPLDFIVNFRDKIVFYYISENKIKQLIKQDIDLSNIKDDLFWYCVSKLNLSFDFIKKYRKKIRFDRVNYKRKNDEFFEEFEKEIAWTKATKDKLSYKVLNDFAHRVNWSYASAYKKLPESFIEEHELKVNWDMISQYQKLSEEFIEKYKEEVNWKYIFECQKFSNEFYQKYKDKAPIQSLLSNKFIKVEAKIV
jgi:phage anti-repressor protein